LYSTENPLIIKLREVEGMEIRTTARHFELTDNLRKFAEDEIKRLEKYYDHIIDCHLTMSVEKSRQIAELTVKVYGTVLTSKAKAFDMYVAVEQVLAKMETQIKKYKSKLREKKTAKRASLKTQPIAPEVSIPDEDLE
jgi:putative sigma-54 modulation protein